MKPLARKNQLIVEELAGECVVYDGTNKKAHSLNSTLNWIWHRCDGSTDVEEMALHFEREFGCADSLDVVLSGIQQLEAANLLELAPVGTKYPNYHKAFDQIGGHRWQLSLSCLSSVTRDRPPKFGPPHRRTDTAGPICIAGIRGQSVTPET
jgi:hypothetical protein